MVAGTKGIGSFTKEIRRRVDKHDPSIAEHWDRLAVKHEVPDLAGKLPEIVDLVAWLDSNTPA